MNWLDRQLARWRRSTRIEPIRASTYLAMARDHAWQYEAMRRHHDFLRDAARSAVACNAPQAGTLCMHSERAEVAMNVYAHSCAHSVLRAREED